MRFLPNIPLNYSPNEIGAAKRMLEWARPGDVLVMPVHDRKFRAEAIALVAQF